jgi:thiol:disulfide interchange protein DsbD
MRRLAAMFVLMAAPALAAPVPQPNMRVELLAETPVVAPGQSVRVGLQLKSDKGWHTYWRNPGDAGSPTEITWTLPEGVTAGAIEWPAPQVIKEGDVVIFGYDTEVLLPSTIRVPASAQPGGTVELKASAHYVVCREICIPGEAELSLTVPVVGAPATAAKPWPSPPAARPGWSARFVQGEKTIELSVNTAGSVVTEAAFLPHEPGQVPPDAPQQAGDEGGLTLRLTRAPELQRELDRIDGLLLATQIIDGRRERIAVVIEATR